MKFLSLMTAGSILLLCLLFACKTSSAPAAAPGKENMETPVATLMTQVSVLLSPKLTPATMLADLSAYDCRSKGRSSRSQNRYTLVFDAAKITPEAFLEKLRTRRGVLEARLLGGN